MRKELERAYRLGSVVMSAVIGSAVFSLYFLFVENLEIYLKIQISVVVGSIMVAMTIQIFDIKSRTITVIVFILGGGIGGAAYSILFGTPLAQSTWLGVALGACVAIGGILNHGER